MKRFVSFVLVLFTIFSLFANPLNYIQERGWKETEKTKEMNLRYHHAYILEGKAFLMWSQNGDKYFIYVYSTDDDIFGYDLDLWTDEMKEKLKTSFRHFKKNKIKNPEEKKEEKQKRFEV